MEEAKRLRQIDEELAKIHKLFDEYRRWCDKKTGKVWFPPGRYFDYDKMVEREHALLSERKSTTDRIKSA